MTLPERDPVGSTSFVEEDETQFEVPAAAKKRFVTLHIGS